MDEKIRDVVKSTKGGVYIDIYLTPGTSRNKIDGVNPWRNCLEVKLKEDPIKGKANSALISYISEHIGVTTERVSLVKGKTSRKKRIFIQGLDDAGVIKYLDLKSD